MIGYTAREARHAARAIARERLSRRPAPQTHDARRSLPFQADALEHVRDLLARVDARLQRLEHVLPPDHDHRVDAGREQRADGVARDPIGLVLEAVDLDEVRARSASPSASRATPARPARRRRPARRPSPSPAPSAPRPRRSRACRPSARRSRRCRRAPSPARGRRLQSNGGRPRPPPLRRWMMSWVMRSPSCSHSTSSRARCGVLGPVDEQVAQQQRRVLHVAPRLLDKLEHPLSIGRPAQPHHVRVVLACAAERRASRAVHTRVHEVVTRSAPIHAIVRADMEARLADHDETLVVGELEISPDQGLVMVEGHAVTLSVREFRLLAALARRAGRIVSREDLYAMAWDGLLRPGDRSVDVYVHKLRSKLEEQAEGRTFIHTHVGFGYRLVARERTPAFTCFSQDVDRLGNTLAPVRERVSSPDRRPGEHRPRSPPRTGGRSHMSIRKRRVFGLATIAALVIGGPSGPPLPLAATAVSGAGSTLAAPVYHAVGQRPQVARSRCNTTRPAPAPASPRCRPAPSASPASDPPLGPPTRPV